MSKLALFGGPKTLDGDHDLKTSWGQKGLEKALCEYTGAKFCRAVSSGTAALISSLFACGCGPGDEVLTVSFTWVATVGAVLRVNAVPIFADIDPQTLTMNSSKNVVANFQALAPILTAAVAAKANGTVTTQRIWTIRLSNTGAGNASATLITGVTLTQTATISTSGANVTVQRHVGLGLPTRNRHA